MFTKHFLKILIFFTLLIALGLAGVFLVGYLDKGKIKPNTVGTSNTGEETTKVAN